MTSKRVFLISRLFVPCLTTALIAMALFGCGGSESSEVRLAPTANTLHVSGVVEDGPLRDARVYLKWLTGDETAAVCGESGNGTCETVTDENGLFRFRVRSDADLSSLRVVTAGGMDSMTGVDFSNLPLETDLVFFSGRTDQVAVTPVTTLLAMARTGLSGLESAEEKVRQMLHLPPDKDLTAWPSQSPEIQGRAILLTKIAMERRKNGNPAPLAGLPDDLGENPLFSAEGLVAAEMLPQIGLDPHSIERTVELSKALSSARPALWGPTFQKVELRQALVENLGLMLEENANSEVSDPRFFENVDNMTQAILKAMGAETIPLGGLVPQRISRYVLFTYGVEQFEDFLLPSEQFRALLSREEEGAEILLEQDPEILRLAQSGLRKPVTVPLLQNELIDTESKHIAYYLNSDASHFYQAEDLVAGIGDAELNDEIMLRLVEGKASFGLFEDARLIAESQIVQTESRGEGLLKIADQLIESGRNIQALELLDLAEEDFRHVVSAKGIANIGNSDTANLKYLASNYRKTGAYQKAQEVLKYLESAVPHLDTPVLFGRLIVGTWQIADEYLDQEQWEEARPLVESLFDLAQRCPRNEDEGHRFYKARVFYLVEAAERFMRLGDAARVLEIFQLVQELRQNDNLENLTLNETWFYMVSLVETLYASDLSQEGMELAMSIPDSYVNFEGKTRSGAYYRTRALKAVASDIALSQGLGAGEDFIKANLSDLNDQIEAWTYFAKNKKSPYIAQQAIEKEFLDLARQALLKARNLVGQLEETSDRNRHRYMIQYGYAKLADLAWEAQDPALARELLSLAETSAWLLSDVEYLVAGLVDVAEVYYTMNEAAEAERILLSALARITGVDPEDAIAMQELVHETFEILVEEPLKNYIAEVRLLFTEGVAYTGTEHDDLAEQEAKALIFAADHYSAFAGNDPELLFRARSLIAEARSVVDQIYVPETRMEIYINDSADVLHLVGAYARAKDFDTAIVLARELPYRSERHLALKTLAEIYCEWDDLPETPFASVDTDGDGLPNFIDPGADRSLLQLSDSLLDSDSDGDGIPDADDRRPLYRD